MAGTSPRRSPARTLPRTLVVGDLHGNLEALDSILRQAQLVDESGTWSGCAARLVQLGDCIDRGLGSEEVLERLASLQDEARTRGGDVVRLLGNHELEVLRGDFGLSDLPDPGLVRGRLIREVLAGRIVAAAGVGEWLCVHGGLPSKMCRQLLVERQARAGPRGLPDLIAHLNEVLLGAVRDEDFAHPIFARGGGIFWTFDTELIYERLTLAIPQIVGHSPRQRPWVEGHRIVFADQGIGAADGVASAYLEFLGGTIAWYACSHHGEWLEDTHPVVPGPLCAVK